jgi:MYXO-CTERM domain-containing protein
MMRRVGIVLGFCGLASVGSAQNIATDLQVRLSFDRTSIRIGETATATLSASWNGVPGSYLGLVYFDMPALANVVQVSNVAPVLWNNLNLGLPGTPAPAGASVARIWASQFSLIPPFDTSNPVLITTFTVTGTVEGSLRYRVQSFPPPGVDGPFAVIGPLFNDPVVYFGAEAFSSETLVVTPGPGVVGVLGVAGFVGVRRRRG